MSNEIYLPSSLGSPPSAFSLADDIKSEGLWDSFDSRCSLLLITSGVN
uniref:Uncharacterized protein n=1 Tax=Arundo donax TaxID=35708 RepID=A0A0A9DEY4_ARUDO